LEKIFVICINKKEFKTSKSLDIMCTIMSV